MRFSKQLANPSRRFSGVLFFLKIPNPLSLPVSSPFWFLLLLSPASSHILLSNFLYGTSHFTLPAWRLHIFLMCGKSTLQKLVAPGGLFQHSLQENIGSGHLRHLNTELETVKQGSKASRNTGTSKAGRETKFLGILFCLGCHSKLP